MEKTIQLFKALSDKSRLKIIATLNEGPMYVELLAQRLDLAPSTISFHLKKLEECGVVTSSKEQYYVVFTLNKDILDNKIIDFIKINKEDRKEERKREEEYKQDVINTFFKDGKLQSMPVQKEKRRIVLEEISKLFEEGKEYKEKEVILMIADFTEDFWTIRNELIKQGLLIKAKGLYYRGDKNKEISNVVAKKIPQMIKNKLFKDEVIVASKYDGFLVDIKDSAYNNVKEKQLYITNRGRILIYQLSTIKGFEIIEHVYSYNIKVESNKNKFEVIYSNDINNEKLDCVEQDNEVICRGKNLKAKSENGLRTSIMDMTINFEIEEFNEIRKKVDIDIFNITG
ncbi:metalloregulator ArsR/SmtB family transcription factor [Clostridium paraputrificum]|uniref:metalloregulator ArsR/SmtB family transcription factor n=1 Tax=Clostridium TaxID=1485 RepID=UPI003D351423